MAASEKALNQADANLDGALERLFELIRIPSISADSNYAGDCRKAAEWIAADLAGLGFEAGTRETDGQPMVVAHWRGKTTAPGPHVLFYGHYDVQPADPANLWKRDAFDPALIEGKTGKIIHGRGSSDDKGQLMTFVEACRALIQTTGELPVPVSILIEGEEESGSVNLGPFLDRNTDELKADLALVCDTAMWDRKTPAITTMLRGLVFEEVIVTAANRDLHSGLYGGAAQNPIRVLTHILAALHDDHGKVTLPGFYDGVPDLPNSVRKQWAALDFPEEQFLADVGLSVPAGEDNHSALEQLWSRPTCDVNGIVGGYIGEGSKTVIPSQASAKISFRLVGDQDPAAIRQAFRDFVRERLPADCSAEFLSHAASPAIMLDMSGPAVSAASGALADEWGKEAALIGMGGSIPIVGDFKRRLGLDALMIGFALEDDAIHSPNEKYELSSFRGGIRSWVRILDALKDSAA
ncbi:MAG: dipeptidase [Rhodobiaceae bacterium]|nr:dipeptidase [Rhodobiaceae bacterium]